MVSRKTQKDVGKFKAKLVGPFTARQTVFFGIGAVVDVLIYSAMHGAGFDINVIAAVCICVIVPFVMFGTVKNSCTSFTFIISLHHL